MHVHGRRFTAVVQTMTEVIQLRLFCLPYSGASAMAYSRWRRLLPAWLQVRPLAARLAAGAAAGITGARDANGRALAERYSRIGRPVGR